MTSTVVDYGMLSAYREAAGTLIYLPGAAAKHYATMATDPSKYTFNHSMYVYITSYAHEISLTSPVGYG